MNRILLLPCLALVAAWSVPAVDEAPKDPPTTAKPDSAALIAKLEALEKRIQSLEQSMVEKDARIADLQKKLAEQPVQPPAPPEVPQGIGGFQLNMTPDQVRDLNRRLDEFFKNNLDQPMGEDPPGAARPNMDEELEQMMREFARERRAIPEPQPQPQPRMRMPAQKPRLGVFMEEVTAQLNALHRNKAEEGAFITRIVPETPADKAGLAPGDCIQSFNGRKVSSTRELTALIAQAPEGRNKIEVMRRGELVTIEVTLDKAPDPAPMAPDVRQEREWVRKQEGGPRREVTEVRSGSLELPDGLAKEMNLNDKSREKLKGAMGEHARKLAEDYVAKTDERRMEGRRALSDQDLQAMAETHALEIEKELKGQLSEEQLETWRRYRAKNGHSVSIFRRILDERGEGENMNF